MNKYVVRCLAFIGLFCLACGLLFGVLEWESVTVPWRLFTWWISGVIVVLLISLICNGPRDFCHMFGGILLVALLSWWVIMLLPLIVPLHDD